MVSYSNDAKTALLAVDPATLARHGAVSRQVVEEMAAGALDRSGADLAVAVSGIAGPDGGTKDKPVGTVWLAWAHRTSNRTELCSAQHHLPGDRETIRAQTVVLALEGLTEILKERG